MPPVLEARALAWTDPLVLFRGGQARADHAFWLDAGPDAADGWSWLGIGAPTGDHADVRTTVVAGARQAASASVPGPFRGGWIGWTGYDAAARAGAPAILDDTAPAELWLRADRFVAIDHGARRLWAVAPSAALDGFVAEVAGWAAAGHAAPPPASAPHTTARARVDGARYAALVERCRDAIREGDAYQLCLTTRFDVEGLVDPVSVYERLRAATPAHHGGFIRSDAHALLSASPEQFLQVSDGIVRTKPIKGTRPRGADGPADALLALELVESVKERAENVMIVDLMRNDLARVCAPATVTVEALLEVESYPAVHQLVSAVAGRVDAGVTVDGLLEAAFPAGSMTGAPKLSAMTILHELEQAPRGVFAGCFGWVGDDGALDLAMVIRSIVVHPRGAYVGAGGGITWRSVAGEEVEEVALKARAPLRALGAELPAGW